MGFVFTLRDNLKWSDGKPLTAEDVVFTYNDIYFNKEIPTDTKDAFKIGESGQLPKVKKLDDRRVEFTLPEPFRPFLQNMSDSDFTCSCFTRIGRNKRFGREAVISAKMEC